MMILALLTLILITDGSAVETHVFGFVGSSVLLPCGCSNDSKLAWQKGEILVSVYPQDESSSIDQAYMNRTELYRKKEKTNCSLTILNISSEDAGVYTCYALVGITDKLGSKKSSKVNLTVSELDQTIPHGLDTISGDKSANAVSISVPILVVLILAVAALLTLLINRRHRTNTDTDLPAQQPMINSV